MSFNQNITRFIAASVAGAALFGGSAAAAVLAPEAGATVGSNVTDHQNIIGDFSVSRQGGPSKMDSNPAEFAFDVSGNKAPIVCVKLDFVNSKGQSVKPAKDCVSK